MVIIAVILSQFLESIHDLVAHDDQGEMSLQEIVEHHLESEYENFEHEEAFVNVSVDCSLDQHDDSIFEALFSCERTSGIILENSVQARFVPHMLRLALPNMTNEYRYIDIGSFLMSKMEAQDIFETIQSSRQPHALSIDVGVILEADIMSMLTHHISNSAIDGFSLLRNQESVTGRNYILTKTMFDSIFDAIISSTTMNLLYLSPVLVAPHDLKSATDTIEKALLQSPSLETLTFYETNEAGSFNMNDIYNRLLCSNKVQNFELLVDDHTHDDDIRELQLSRTNPWQPFLSRHVPSDLWPFVLAKANEWNEWKSHTSLDAMYFLLKEKGDVLLQNIHRRKRRKRKRFQFEA